MASAAIWAATSPAAAPPMPSHTRSSAPFSPSLKVNGGRAVGCADSGGHVRNEEVVLVVLANQPNVSLTEDLDRDVGGRWHRAAEASSYLEPE